MAKLKGPLFSLGASGKIGDALVFFGWKGLNVVREYVVPSNPRTSAQTTQRGYLSSAVARVHEAMAVANYGLDSIDAAAYALWGSTFATPRTWFNQAVKNIIDQMAATPARIGRCFHWGRTTPGTDELGAVINYRGVAMTAGNFHYGTSKTALLSTKVAVVSPTACSATITGLTTGVKYFWQFRATTPANAVGVRSGIYYGVPT